MAEEDLDSLLCKSVFVYQYFPIFNAIKPVAGFLGGYDNWNVYLTYEGLNKPYIEMDFYESSKYTAFPIPRDKVIHILPTEGREPIL